MTRDPAIPADAVRQRVRILMRGHTQETFAKRVGVSAQYLGDFLAGRREPGPKLLAGIGFERVTLYRQLAAATWTEVA